ncbi:efflux transporter periplasmic adaptor subunit [Fischerella thermalis CCMEE 5268]|uniref:Efflux transporter periplasmic adaptor subunit n=1 Tax=Fischerella thermalis CCMEE 5268 TaxID=2019662 RepID=A0A2N6KLW3_9CYAN|nr:efflux transporter periplasmic adaptor subunit [Fischerella thermalis CCMEE 5268]
MTRFSRDKRNVESSADVSLLTVKTTNVKPVTSYQVSRTYTGEVQAVRASELGFERGGKLIWFGVDRGNRVTTGTALAKLDTTNLEAKRQELIAQKDRAVAVLEELQTGPRNEDIATARAQVKEIEEQLKLEHLKRTRRKYLYETGAISKEQYDEVAFNSNALFERLSAAKSKLDELLAGTRKEQIAAQKAAVKQLEAGIADIEITIAKSTIKAPFAGIIAARRLDEGTVVNAGQAVLRLMEDVRPELEIGIPVSLLSQLKIGTKQSVQIGETTYAAKVSSILPEIDLATRTRTVILTLEQSAKQSVAPGQIGRLKIAQTVSTTGYWLPISALVQGKRGLWSCYALTETENSPKNLSLANANATKPYRVERRDVEVVHTEGDRVLVRGAIESGDNVIVDGIQRIVPGQLVHIAGS